MTSKIRITSVPYPKTNKNWFYFFNIKNSLWFLFLKKYSQLAKSSRPFTVFSDRNRLNIVSFLKSINMLKWDKRQIPYWNNKKRKVKWRHLPHHQIILPTTPMSFFQHLEDISDSELHLEVNHADLLSRTNPISVKHLLDSAQLETTRFNNWQANRKKKKTHTI